VFRREAPRSTEPQIDFSHLMFYDQPMRKPNGPAKTKHREMQVPVFIEKDEDGFYVVECPLFEGCYSQGKTVDEALRTIREVIYLIVEEKRNREILRTYHPKELSLHTITL
jgi:predicted RNase H-like HicB family nuclease